MYMIGLEDCGNPLGLERKAMYESISTICLMAKQLDFDPILTKVQKGFQGLISILKVRKSQKQNLKEAVKLMMMGQQKSGKSTLIGILMSGQCDDGQGSARMQVLNHKHEVLSGQTQSISLHLLGFKEGNIVNTSNNQWGYNNSWEQIIESSDHIFQIIDIGGQSRYNQMFIQTILQQQPKYMVLVIDSTLQKNTIDQIMLILKLKI